MIVDFKKPSLNSRGAYDNDELGQYFRDAKGMGDVEIARQLDVEVHRVIFMKKRLTRKTETS